MNSPVRFVLIGSGAIARVYLFALKNLPEARAVGVVSRSAKTPVGFSELPAFRSLNEVDIPFDAVLVCTPNGLHLDPVVEAAGLGKHVLCEKPIEIEIERIDRMIAACRAAGVKLGVTYQRRFSAHNPLVKRLIEAGKLGRILSVDLTVRNYRDERYFNSAPYRGTRSIDGGGCFMMQASHYIDLYCWFFGRPDHLISKVGTLLHPIEVEDHGAVICVHEGGPIATITASTVTRPGFPAKMEIYTDRGFLVMVDDVITEWAIEGMANPAGEDAQRPRGGTPLKPEEETLNQELVIRDFVRAIRQDREPLVNGEAARIATEVILEIYDRQFC